MIIGIFLIVFAFVVVLAGQPVKGCEALYYDIDEAYGDAYVPPEEDADEEPPAPKSSKKKSSGDFDAEALARQIYEEAPQ